MDLKIGLICDKYFYNFLRFGTAMPIWMLLVLHDAKFYNLLKEIFEITGKKFQNDWRYAGGGGPPRETEKQEN